MSIATSDFNSLHCYAKLFAAAYELPTDSGFVIMVERDGEYQPFGWAVQLPTEPFAPFYSFAVSLETGESFKRRGNVGECGRWV